MQKGLLNRTRKPLSNSRVLLYGVIWGYLGLSGVGVSPKWLRG